MIAIHASGQKHPTHAVHAMAGQVHDLWEACLRSTALRMHHEFAAEAYTFVYSMQTVAWQNEHQHLPWTYLAVCEQKDETFRYRKAETLSIP